ncbi:hypothetical protein NPIL_677741 [Nephila pilipes]|uniref:Uncharacterized protein n=1 Tax=Nephila pilipes TaxID=299642 RepID=A0A8X6PFY1_NEPPI|nr:hypothetical protein NPIL_677741 [Nephila pilipes]
MFLSYGNCAVSPILYAVLCEQFRRSIWNILKRIPRQFRRSSTCQKLRSALIYILEWNTSEGRDNDIELPSREYELIN